MAGKYSAISDFTILIVALEAKLGKTNSIIVLGKNWEASSVAVGS